MKYFIWMEVQNGVIKNSSPFSTFYTHWRNLIGSKSINSLEDLLKMPLSETIKKRLISSKPNTWIKVHYLHSTGYVYLKCLSDDDYAIYERIIKLENDRTEVNEEIQRLIPKELKDKQKEVNKELEKISKYFGGRLIK